MDGGHDTIYMRNEATQKGLASESHRNSIGSTYVFSFVHTH